VSVTMTEPTTPIAEALSQDEIAQVAEALKGITPLPWYADEPGFYIFAKGTPKRGFGAMVADGDGEPELFIKCRRCDGSGVEHDADDEEDNCRDCGGQRYQTYDHHHVAQMRGFGSGQPQERNLHAIATVMNAAPRLLATIERLQRERDALRVSRKHMHRRAQDAESKLSEMQATTVAQKPASTHRSRLPVEDPNHVCAACEPCEHCRRRACRGECSTTPTETERDR
jgi:hypothetical protein